MSNLSSTILSKSARSVRLLKINGCPPYPCPRGTTASDQHIASRWEVAGYQWETRFYSLLDRRDGYCYRALELVFLNEALGKEVMANLSYRLVDPSGVAEPSAEGTSPKKSFQRPSDSSGKLWIMQRSAAHPKYVKADGSVTVECTVTVIKEEANEQMQLPLSDLHNHRGELLRSEAGADVTFVVAGESFGAHKNVLAARSPVFKAQFFGELIKDKTSHRIEIKEMEAAVFRTILGFIYTDMPPEELELDSEKQDMTTTIMAQHQLVAADRFGLDRLKMMCECRIARGVDAATAAASLALEERHGCSLLKATCVEFITGATAENLVAIMATDGFKCLDVSLLTELFRAAHGRTKK